MMGVRQFLNRADKAVQDTSTAVTVGVALGAAALIVAAVALVVAVRR
jgi:ABC-type lipoprotein release transport system permease subunit